MTDFGSGPWMQATQRNSEPSSDAGYAASFRSRAKHTRPIHPQRRSAIGQDGDAGDQSQTLRLRPQFGGSAPTRVLKSGRLATRRSVTGLAHRPWGQRRAPVLLIGIALVFFATP